MSDPMQEIRDSFFIECEELLESLQDALGAMEGGDHGSETINVAFRAVHSIKGGAGAFGLDQLVGFAHRFETVMDEVRGGALEPDASVISLFFQCGDTLSDLVRAARGGDVLSETGLEPLVAELTRLSGESDVPDTADSDVDFAPLAISLDLPGAGDDGARETLPPLAQAADRDDSAAPALAAFDVRFCPHPELYRNGNDPLLLLRALAALGTAEITCDVADPPDLDDYGADTCLLSWRVSLETEAGEEAIREIFDFVDGLCTLEIVPAAEAEPPADPAPPPEANPPETSEAPPGVCPPEADGSAAPRATPTAQTVRVDLDRVDRLVNLVGELVINQAMLSQSLTASGVAGNSEIAAGLDEFQQLTRDIQDSVMMIRAQPVKSLFQRMGRIVREASASVGKTVRLQTEGETTEIDKTVIERLADPLTHMIRNAVDHGLETTDDRLAAGKPAEGTVTLGASHRSGRVVIEIADDGAGIDRDRVRSIAETRGLIPQGLDLAPSDIDNLLFLPGFSTAREISNLSGRGVGMDVVKNAINALGGRISITSETGRGTTFSISLPLTLAVLDGMVIRVAGETLVLPLSAISETLSVGEGAVRALGPATQVIRVRDSLVPLIDLGTELGYAQPRDNYQGAIVLLIAQEDGKRAALVVDGIEDQRQVVIKGLEDSYGRVPGVAAATILGDGQVALILDPADLLANASGRSRPDPRPALAGTG